MDKQTTLARVFGYSSYKPGQEELIENTLSGRDVLGIMPTGAGKSICYQVPALLMEGITLVVSPLISLMKDQVTALVQAGVPAAYLNSSLSYRQYQLALERATAGQYKIIYVAPERLLTPEFLAFAQSAAIAMVTVDEAHCVSQWGQDFRPGYLRIAEFVRALPSRPVVGAFTATATTKVQQDIIALLELQSPAILVTGFNRENLYFEVRKPENKLRELFSIVNAGKDGSGIIYCATRKAVEQVCAALCDRGYAATRYHAGLEPAERQQNQEAFIQDDKPFMVATNAFGMGIDKSNVSFVVHYNMPKNLESYYQEAGRAGRDGTAAQCILLYSPGDVRTGQFLIEHSRDEEDLPADVRKAQIAHDLELLKRMTWYCTTTDCLRSYILQYFGEKAPVYCGTCGNCDTSFEKVDITAEAQKIAACVADLEQQGRSFGKGMITNLLHGSRNERTLRLGLDRSPFYGSLAELPVYRIGNMVDHLTAGGWLEITGGEYPVLSTTASTRELTTGAEIITMMLPQKQQKSFVQQQEGELDTVLFGKLREKRATLAKRAGVPAYVIFTDAALRDMCHKKPTTEDGFLQVSGVGQSKLARYGEEFLAVLRSYEEEE